MTRRLAAIMFTDIAGFTATAHTDEAGAFRLLREQDRLVRPTLEKHHGRKVKSTGDGLLIEFPDALDAVECAVELQRRIHEHNTKEGVRPLHVRMGIHIGDVERRGTDIVGDAVNIASRVQSLADPEGVWLSGPVCAQVRNKVPYQFEDLGPKYLKGVREPMEVYQVVLPWAHGEVRWEHPGLPRLAVLPLANISPDPNDEYFADGLTEELITVLSQLRDLRVIARTSVVPYKSTPKPIPQLGAELGVSSVLEGSVRKVGDRLRISVQLIDVDSQEHTWVETYDRGLDDVFAIQADVAQRIAQVLKIKVGSAEKARLEGRAPPRPESYLAYLRGRALFSTAEWVGSEPAKDEFEKAASLDPSNAGAYSGLADVTHVLGEAGRLGARDGWFRQSKQYALRALELDPNLADAHASIGSLIVHEYDYVGAERELQRALSLSPSNAFAHLAYGLLLADRGLVEEAFRELSFSEESDPHSLVPLAHHAYLLVRYRQLDQAVPIFDRLGRLRRDAARNPQLCAIRAIYYGARSEFRRAHGELDRAEKTRPGLWWDDRTFLYVLAGDYARARKLLEESERAPDSAACPQPIAWCHGILGDYDECFRWLGVSIDKHEVTPRAWLGEPLLEPVRKDPRFTQLWKAMNLA